MRLWGRFAPRLVFVVKRSRSTRKHLSGLPDPERWSYAQGDHELRCFRWIGSTADGGDGGAADRLRFLLIHGIGMGHLTFTRFIEALLPYAEIIAVDLPGFGDSPEPETALSIADTAELVAEAMRAASVERGIGPLIAVGHSMGAQVVSELAAAHPELVDRMFRASRFAAG